MSVSERSASNTGSRPASPVVGSIRSMFPDVELIRDLPRSQIWIEDLGGQLNDKWFSSWSLLTEADLP